MLYTNDAPGSVARKNVKPVLLIVMDGIRSDILRAAIREGDAPNLGSLEEAGESVWNGVSVFPSITPAATAAIATGEAPDGSGILGHAWYDRRDERVVVYGAMTGTVISTGPLKVFHNNVWRMNRDDLLAETFFERLHEVGVDGACVHFPVRRGPHDHAVRSRVVRSVARRGVYFGHTVQGPKELYLGDLFYSRDTGFQGRLGAGGMLRKVGINDEYAASVGAHLLEEDAAPLTLVYFFQGDSIAHHRGLAAQRQYLKTLDQYVGKLFDAAGGVERALSEYAIMALSDHGHSPLVRRQRYVRLGRLLGERAVAGARAGFARGVEVIAVPNGRAALLYLRENTGRKRLVERLVSQRGVDLAAWYEDGWGVVRGVSRSLRFRPVAHGGALDPSGGVWEVDGDIRTLDLSLADGRIVHGEYPDALERLWSCLVAERSGDVVLSASPGYTFGEVSGMFHEASDHGSLHESDSRVFVLSSGFEGVSPRRITEVAPALLSHFGAGISEAARAS